MTRGLLLDLDGTLAESLGVMRWAYEQLLSENRRIPSEEEFNQLNGPPLIECARMLRETHALEDPVEQLVNRWFGIISDAYLRVQPSIGAAHLLETAKNAGWKTAIVTSSIEKIAASWLASVNLINMIDTIVDGNMVRRGKPAPDGYLEAMRRLDVEPARCVAVEDTVTGAQAAQASGALTYGIASSATITWPDGVQEIDGLTTLAWIIAGHERTNPMGGG